VILDWEFEAASSALGGGRDIFRGDAEY